MGEPVAVTETMGEDDIVHTREPYQEEQVGEEDVESDEEHAEEDNIVDKVEKENVHDEDAGAASQGGVNSTANERGARSRISKAERKKLKKGGSSGVGDAGGSLG